MVRTHTDTLNKTRNDKNKVNAHTKEITLISADSDAQYNFRRTTFLTELVLTFLHQRFYGINAETFPDITIRIFSVTPNISNSTLFRRSRVLFSSDADIVRLTNARIIIIIIIKPQLTQHTALWQVARKDRCPSR